MSPRIVIQPLAALTPSLRLHLIRFCGVLAPNANLRVFVAPSARAARAGSKVRRVRGELRTPLTGSPELR